MEIIEQLDKWRQHFNGWQRVAGAAADDLSSYTFVKNRRAPFTPARRALPMLNLALISSAGAYIDGTEPFDLTTAAGDLTFREIPSEIEADDLKFCARGYDPAAVEQDINSLVPLNRLLEFAKNGVIGQLNPVFWSCCGFIPDAGALLDEMLPALVERIKRHEVQAALLIPASPICHQTVFLAARAIEVAGIPTMTISVDKEIVESVRPPRAAYYQGELGSVAGQPNWPEQQRRILDEALRWMESMDQPGMKKLGVDMESAVENSRGER